MNAVGYTWYAYELTRRSIGRSCYVPAAFAFVKQQVVGSELVLRVKIDKAAGGMKPREESRKRCSTEPKRTQDKLRVGAHGVTTN